MSYNYNKLANYEVQVEEKKALRAMYEFCIDYGNLNIEYEGEIKRLGDTVQIRPRSYIMEGIQPYRSLTVDKVLPRSSKKLQALLNIINWEVEGDLVIACVDHEFLVGYNELV